MSKDQVITFYVKDDFGYQYIYLTEKQLNQYPDSYLTLMVPFIDQSNLVQLDGFTGDVLNEIEHFYQKGYWNFNPYMTGTKFMHTFCRENGEKIDNFEKFCDFLGLPVDIGEIENDSDNEYDNYDEFIEDDFDIYSPPSEDEDEDYEEEYGYCRRF